MIETKRERGGREEKGEGESMCIENLSYPGSLRSFHSSLSGLPRWRIFNPPSMVSWDISLNFANNIAREKILFSNLLFFPFLSMIYFVFILYWFYIKFLFDIVFFFLLQWWFNKFSRLRTSVSFEVSNATAGSSRNVYNFTRTLFSFDCNL